MLDEVNKNTTHGDNNGLYEQKYKIHHQPLL